MSFGIYKNVFLCMVLKIHTVYLGNGNDMGLLHVTTSILRHYHSVGEVWWGDLMSAL